MAGIIALFFTAACALEVMRPHKLTLWPEGEERLDWYAQYQAYMREHKQEDRSGELLIPQMARDMTEWYQSNRKKMTWVQKVLTAAFVGVALQFALWGTAYIR